MAKEISRRDFLKGVAAGTVTIAASQLLAGCGSSDSSAAASTGATEAATAAASAATEAATAAATESAVTGYTPGTYTATAKGMESDVTVTMTFDETSITDVQVDTSGETETIGAAAQDELKDQLLAAQGSEIDGVSGATVTSNAVKEAAANCIAQAKGISVSAQTEDTTDTAEISDDWLGEEPSIEEADIAGEKDYDVVIIGAGLAGVCAARAAAEEGASVALVEKSKSFNCRSGEYAVINGSLNERWGRTDILDENTVINGLMSECKYHIKRSIVKKWYDNCGDVMDWFISADPDLRICDTTREVVTQDEFDHGIVVPLAWPQPRAYDYKEEAFPTYPSSLEFRSSRADQQGFIVEANLNAALDAGATAYFGCFGTKLEKDDDGRITGVIIRDAENGNRYIRLNAAKGVILATGDCGADDSIMKAFAPEVLAKGIVRTGTMGMMGVDVEGNPSDTGDGLRLGAWAGAKVQEHFAPMTHHMGGGMGVTPFLQINKRGKRFMNEALPGQQLENQLELQPDMTSYQIYDSNWGEEIPYMPANHGGLCYIIPESEDTSNPNYTDRQYTKVSEKADAATASADTLEDLLTQLGFEGDDLTTALASIDRYNELADKGDDEDFGKPAKHMFAINKGPFYACEWTPTIMLVCMGGLESDEDCHTYTGTEADPDRKQIPGLYVAGNVQGDRFAIEYPISLRGVSHSMAMYYGYVAGKNAANEV